MLTLLKTQSYTVYVLMLVATGVILFTLRSMAKENRYKLIIDSVSFIIVAGLIIKFTLMLATPKPVLIALAVLLGVLFVLSRLYTFYCTQCNRTSYKPFMRPSTCPKCGKNLYTKKEENNDEL